MFNKAVKDAFEWSFKWYFGSFSGAIGTFFFFEKYMEFERIRSLRYGVAIFFLAFCVKVIIQYIKMIDELQRKVDDRDKTIEILNSKKEKNKLLTSSDFYGEAILSLTNIFAKIHYVRKKEREEQKNLESDKKELIAALIYLCNNIKSLLEQRFKYNYSVCIKVLASDKDLENLNYYAEISTLCRDETSFKRRSQPNIVKHNIFENTCFVEIFNKFESNTKAFFLCNDLPEDKYYKNSSFKIHGEIPSDCLTPSDRRNAWTLPYKSELVVPICPINSIETDIKKEFLGYLCVDCNEEDAFHINYDARMLQGIADGIYDIIKIYTIKQKLSQETI